MKRFLDWLTPKKIVSILFTLYIFSIAWGEIIPDRNYKLMLDVFNHVGFFYTIIMLLAADLYSLRLCTPHPQFTPFQYGTILYPAPIGLALGIIFIVSLRRSPDKKRLVWKIALIWTLLVTLASATQLFTYFCYPMRFY